MVESEGTRWAGGRGAGGPGGRGAGGRGAGEPGHAGPARVGKESGFDFLWGEDSNQESAMI